MIDKYVCLFISQVHVISRHSSSSENGPSHEPAKTIRIRERVEFPQIGEQIPHCDHSEYSQGGDVVVVVVVVSPAYIFYQKN